MKARKRAEKDHLTEVRKMEFKRFKENPYPSSISFDPLQGLHSKCVDCRIREMFPPCMCSELSL